VLTNRFSSFVLFQFQQFARTLLDAAVEQQRDINNALESLSNTLSLSADLIGQGQGNPTWPYFFPPRFETYAKDFRATCHAELVGISNIVTKDQREPYIRYTTAHYQDAVKEAHLTKYGNLDNLDLDSSSYHPYFTKKGENGSIAEDDERDSYFVQTTQSPPDGDYDEINFNIASENDVRTNIDTVLLLQNETIISGIRPFIGLDEHEHNALHSDHNDGGETAHCFAFRAIHKDPDSDGADIVAVLTTAFSFDIALRDLLPDNVNGLLAVIDNGDCQQTMSYLVNGHEAIFLGMADMHDRTYHDMAANASLSLYDNPQFPYTTGHCMYTMVSSTRYYRLMTFVSTQPAEPTTKRLSFSCSPAASIPADSISSHRIRRQLEKQDTSHFCMCRSRGVLLGVHSYRNL